MTVILFVRCDASETFGVAPAAVESAGATVEPRQPFFATLRVKSVAVVPVWLTRPATGRCIAT